MEDKKNAQLPQPNEKDPSDGLQSKTVEDLEVKDAQLIFQSVWHELEEEVGVENLRFPAEIFWLNGAPGAGKGTQTAFIMEFRDLTEKPIIVSELLKSPEARKRLMRVCLLVIVKLRKLFFAAYWIRFMRVVRLWMDIPEPKPKAPG